MFVCGPLDMRRRVVKLLLKDAQVVDCGTIETEADAERWVKARAARENVNLEPAAAAELVDRAGLDIVRLRAGFERVTLYALGQPAITADDVRQAVPAGRRRRPIWASPTRSGATTRVRRCVSWGWRSTAGTSP